MYMYNELNHFANILSERTNSFLEDLTRTKPEYFPLFLCFAAKACYVKYDTIEEQITDISLIMIEKHGFIIEIDPIGKQVRSRVANEVCGSLQMIEHVADTLQACIRMLWKRRLSTEYLITTNGNKRYVAADLLAEA